MRHNKALHYVLLRSHGGTKKGQSSTIDRIRFCKMLSFDPLIFCYVNMFRKDTMHNQEDAPGRNATR